MSIRRYFYTIGFLLTITILAVTPSALFAQDKSGVKPQVISLPSGPGSLEGLGENFEPNLSTGTSSYPIMFSAAPGRVGFQPELSLNYDGGNANGPWGMGWQLSIPAIQRRTEDGLPTYNDAQDTFIFSNGEKLVALKDGSYRFENESSFMRFRRIDGGWEAQTPDGIRYLFGATENARVANAKGTFRWELERMIDTHGNELQYTYLHDGDYAYPREIRYNFGENNGGENNGGGLVYNAVIFNYAPRPDTYTDRRSGAPIRVGLRGTDIQMWALGKLVRAYAFTYEPERSTGKYSLLIKVEQVGDDGVSKLPPQSFTYTQFDASAHGVVTMQNPPPVVLTNPDADLVDINADGLPDLVYTPEDGQHRFYLNRGHGRWQVEPVLPQHSPAERLSNPNVRMADMDGDGVVDLLVKASGTGAPLYYYSNKSGAEWQQNDRVDFGPAPAFDLNDPNVQLMDVNNDHRIDVVLTASGRLKIWLAREGAWSQTADFDVPAPAAGDAANFADPKFKIGDMTGDRMDDVVMVRDGQVVLWEHNGNGSYEEPRPILNPPSGVGAQDVMIQMGDLNNDGQMDLVLPGNRSVTYWLSLGDGSLADPITIPDTPAFDAQSTAVRLADIDGDGATELLFSSNQGMAYVDFSTQEQPFLLRSVDNGLGRTIRITYKSSIEDYIADWDGDNPWQVNLPFPVQVVNKVTVHDANSGDDYAIDYHYRDGYYDGEQKEFRGFVRSQETKVGDDTAATTVTNLVYDVGMSDEAHKGLLLESEVLSVDGHCSGDYAGCFQRTVNELTTRVVVDNAQTQTNQPIAYAFISQADTFVYEQQATPVQLRQQFAQDDYGNQTQQFNFGQVCGPQANLDVTCGNDELLTYTEYIYDQDRYFFNRPLRTYQTDVTGTLVSDQRMYYDGEPFVGLPAGQLTRGDLMRQEESLGPNGAGKSIPTKRQRFDSFGNVVALLDANGNLTTVEFDALVHTFPVLERRHLADGKTLTYAASYHYGLGKVNAATDYNGNAYLYTFDTFGRMAKMVEPGDTLALPTAEYSYFMGSPRSFIRVDKRERSGESGVQTTVTYFDGLGRTLQARVETENGEVTVTDAKRFNARQTVSADYLPYVDSGFAYRAPDTANPATTYMYDAMARVTRTGNPDGTFSTVSYQPLQQMQFDEEDNREPNGGASPHAHTPKTLTYDGLNRLIETTEINVENGQPLSIVARYTYDPLNNLMAWQDQAGNLRANRYDALSRKLQTVDPDRGTTNYQYDDNGNLIKQQDAKGQTILYTYDAANRLLTERWQFTNGQADVVAAHYHYDADLSPRHPQAQNTMGQISYIEDQVGVIYFSYDAHGNTIGQARYFAQENLTFVTNFTFDAQDRTTSVRYPNGITVGYEYDARGLLKRIPGFVDAITYGPDGQRATIEYANGTQTTYGFDIRQRLTHLQTNHGAQILQDLTYLFDGASNIITLTDGRPTRTPANDQTQQYRYDSLYRLVQATGTYGQIDYRYDPLGNMVSQDSTTGNERLQTGIMRYGENGAGPHALTSAAGESYAYDANGNLVRKGPLDESLDTLYRWDARDRLIGVDGGGISASYAYNADSQRLKQTVRMGDKVTTTLYIGQYARLQGDQLSLYIFDDETRVAELAMTFDATQLLTTFDSTPTTTPPANLTRHWYVADHLGGTNLLTDDAGAIIAETVYYPYGVTRMASAADATPYGFAGKELDATGLTYVEARYYDASTGRFLSVDPLYHKFTGDPAKNESYRKYLEHTQLGNGYAYSLGNPLKYVDPDGREVHISKGLRSVPQFMKAWQMFKATREGQRLLKSLADSGRTVYLRAGRPFEYDTKVKGQLGATELAINYNMSPNEDGVIVNINKHVNMHQGDVVNLRKELADTIHHELRHSEIRAQVPLLNAVQSLADKLGVGDRINSYREMQDHVDNLKDDLNLDFRREIDFGGH